MSYNIKHKQKNQDHSNYLLIFIFGFFVLVLFINVIRLGSDYWQKSQVLDKQTAQLEAKKQEQDRLKYELKQSQTEEFLEQQARKLTLSKPGEYVVIVTSPSPTPRTKPSKTAHISNYKLWWNLFFKYESDN